MSQCKRIQLALQSHLLILQDGMEVYLVFPVYNKGYVNYLSDKGPMRPNSMKIYQYGPFMVDNDDLSAIVLAHSIREDRLGDH